jgi:hypothetical protein
MTASRGCFARSIGRFAFVWSSVEQNEEPHLEATLIKSAETSNLLKHPRSEKNLKHAICEENESSQQWNP